MAQYDAIVNIGGLFDERAFESKLQQSLSKIEKGVKFTPFSGASRNVRDFNSELDRANQRVITLGASFAVLSTSIRVFKDIVNSTTAVEKALTDINSVFQLSTKGMEQFSRGLFDVARETSQSFEKTADAAKEFSRQGLGATDVLKRTRDAMVLTRLASLDAEEAVSTLTAAINGFQKTALDSTQIVNKLATVDAQFAVSSKDLAQGLARAGAAANDAGVSFDNLIGLITSAQQTTARGGAVIGNALKTIFTRVERKDTLEAFESLGVAITDLSGNVLPAMKLLQNFANVYDKLGGSVKKQAAELVGGVYQINILKALLSDLSKGSSSVAEQAAKTSANAADEAIKRNEALNKSLAALAQQAQTTYQQIGAKVGDIGFSGAAKNVLSGVSDNFITKTLINAGDSDTNSIGEKAAAGFIKGFGNAVIFGLGPTLLLALSKITLSVFGKIQRDFSDLIGANTAAKEQAGIQEQIVGLYNAGDTALKRQLLTMGSLAERAAMVESILARSANRQTAVSAEINSLAGAVIGIRKTPRAAGGYDPFSAEAAAIRAGVGGASPNAKPVMLQNFAYGGGVSGPIVANTSEWMVKTGGGSAIYNPAMIQKMGLPPGATPIAAGGYLPGEGSSRQVQNIIDAYRSSFSKSDSIRFSQAERASTYYPTVNQEIRGLSLKTGRSMEQLSYGLAALSANTPDLDARRSLESLAMGGDPIGAIPGANTQKALRIFGASTRDEMVEMLGNGAKTQNFASSLLLEKTFSGFGKFKSKTGVPAVMDSWAIYVRNGGAAAEKYNRDAVSEEQKRLLFKQSKRGYSYYNKLSSEYEEAARILGIDVSDLQSRTWGYARGQPGSPTRMSAAGGYDPLSRESNAIRSGIGGADSGAMPVYLPNFARGGGQMGIVANTSEFIVPTSSGKAIYTKEMASKFGLPSGATPIAAGGYIPNMAKGGNPYGLPPEWSSPDYYKNLGKAPEPYGPAAPTSDQWAAMEQEKRRFLEEAFRKEKAEIEKQQAAEEKLAKLKEKKVAAYEAKEAKKAARYQVQATKDLARQEKINAAMVLRPQDERYEAAGLVAIQAKQAMEAKFPNHNASPETMAAFMSARAASAGSGSSYNAWIAARANAANPPPPPAKYIPPFLERTFAEKFFKRDFQNLTLKDLSYSSSLPMPWVNGPSTDRTKESQMARGFASRNIVSGSGVNYLQLGNSLRASRGLAGGSTIDEQFNTTVQDLLKSGKGMNTAYNAAIAEVMKETTNRAQINRIIRESIPVNVAFEKAMAENFEAVITKNKQNRVAINLQATQNQISATLGSGGLGALDPRQRSIYLATIRREEAQRLGFQNGNVGGNAMAKAQIDDAVNRRISQSFSMIPDTLGVPQKAGFFSRMKAGFANNPLAGQLALSMGLPMLGGALPSAFSEESRRGGSTMGMGIGAASSALTFAGTGAAIGSFIPGVGTGLGAGIGAVLGGISGALSKLTISFEEAAQGVSDANAKLRVQSDAVSAISRISSDITRLSSEGGKGTREMRQLEKAREEAMGVIEDPTLRRLMAGGMSEREKGEKLQREELQKKSIGGNIYSAFSGAMEMDRTSLEDSSKAASRVSSALVPFFQGMKPEEMSQYSRKIQTNPLGAIQDIMIKKGISPDQINRLMPGDFNPNQPVARNLAWAGGMDAIAKARALQRDEALGSVARKNDEKRMAGILELSESYKRESEYGKITAGANQSIFGVQKQIAFSTPGLTDLDKIRLESSYAKQASQNQYETETSSHISDTKSKLLGMIRLKGGESPQALERIQGINGVGSIKSLIADLSSPESIKKSGLAGVGGFSDEFKKALEESVRSQEVLSKSLEEQNRATNENTIALEKDYLFKNKTREGGADAYKSKITDIQDAIDTANARNDTPDIIQSLQTALELAKVGARYQAGGSTLGYDIGSLRTRLQDSRAISERNIEAVRGVATGPNAHLVSGSMLQQTEFEAAKNAGQMGKSMESLYGGFKSVFVKMKKDMNDLSDLGANLGQSLSSNLSGAFGDFVTGAKSGKDAFRSFATSVLNDASRMFASQAIQGILGSIFGGVSSSAGVSIGQTKTMPFAAGGKVPAMLTGGEYYVGPNAARKIGYDTLHRLNGYADGGIVRGGSGVKDDVPAHLAPGSFIIKKSAVNKLGPDYLNDLVEGKVQHRFIGGLLMGALVGGGIGYLTGGKKGAIAGAIVGGIGGGLAQNYSQTGSIFHSDSSAGMFQFGRSAVSSSGATLSVGESGMGGDAGIDMARTSAPQAGGVSSAAKAPAPMWQKAAWGLGAAALLGGASRMLAPKDPKFTPMTAAQISANRASLEAAQRKTQTPVGYFPWLETNSNGGRNLAGYVEPIATRRMYAGGGMVENAAPISFPSMAGGAPLSFSNGGGINGMISNAPMIGAIGAKGNRPLFFSEGGAVGPTGGVDSATAAPTSSSRGSSSSSNVNVKIEINNNGQTSASATSSNKDGQGGFGPDFAQKLQKQVQSIVQQELVTQSRSDGFFSQRSRYIQR